MKLSNKIYVYLAFFLAVAAMGCRKDAFNINKDINNPTDSTVTYDVVLPAALHASGTILAYGGTAGNVPILGSIQNWMGYWSRSGTYAPNVVEETYQITTGFGTAIWNNIYDNNYDYEIVQLKAHQAGADFYEGIARIMKAHNYQQLVDVYGNVPYTDALRGSANPTPKYDNALDVYKDLFREIDAGIDLIKNATVTATNPNKNIWLNDIMFGDPVNGTIALIPAMRTKWAKFGNTVKLRMLIHAYAVAGIDKTAEMAIINTEGSGFLGAGENAQVNPGYKSDKPNPFYNNYKNGVTGSATAANVYFAANEWGIDYYNLDHDPRVSRFYTAGSGGLIGVPYGIPPTAQYASGTVANIGPGVYKANTAPQAIITSAESFFLQAEARIRGFITSGPSAATLLETAKLENMLYLGVPGAASALAAYNAYNAGYPDVDITAPPAGPGLPAGGLFTVLQQKWFALNAINTLEVWTDYRRVPYSEVATKAGASTTHFVYGEGGGYLPGPPISVAPQNTSTQIPVRLLYPQTEYNYNATNVSAQGVINQFTSRIFWDIN